MTRMFYAGCVMIFLCQLLVAHSLFEQEHHHDVALVRNASRESFHAHFVDDQFHYLSVRRVGSSLVWSPVECSLACLRVVTCFSVNVAAKPDREGRLQCELLASDKYNSSDKFHMNSQFHHYSILTPCSQNPCENKGKCVALYHKDDFMCACPPGYKGKRCENHAEAALAFTFTTLGFVGREGPKNVSGYMGTSLQGKVQLNSGVQIWEVPKTGSYEIEARGASGGDGKNVTAPSFVTFGGLGARVRGHFYLRKGTLLKILVGQRGTTVRVFLYDESGTGGGGSFVTRINNTALIVAGGGGGGCADIAGAEDGDPGRVGRNGSQNGGVEGSGGKLLIKDGVTLLAGAGGGFWIDGEIPMGPPMDEAQSFINGGKGGANSFSFPVKTDGGFGGGGGSVADPGGGGGYSGGGVCKTKNVCKAGGGGSYNEGVQQLNEEGFNKGDGQVSINFVN